MLHPRIANLANWFRPANLLIVGSYLALSAIPLLPLLLGRGGTFPWSVLGLEASCWLLIWSLFKRPVYFHLLLLPAFIALPIEFYLQMFYGQGISSHHLGIIVETSPKEAFEFLGNKVWLLGVLLVGIIGWWWSCWMASWRTRAFDWRHPSRWVVLLLSVCLSASWVYGQRYGVARAHGVATAASLNSMALKPAQSASDASSDEDDEDASDSEDASSADASATIASTTPGWPPRLPHWAAIPVDHDILSSSWPFGLVVRVSDFLKDRRYLGELAEKSKQFVFGAHQVGIPDTQQTVVVVIGESSRFDRWGINGYQRDTTPLLSKESNLVSLADMVTSVSATRLSVPVIVSRKPATQSLTAGFAEKSFLSAYKEAGFKTFWLSNQMSFGEFDTPVSVFAKEADVIQFLNLGDFHTKSNFDEVLLEPYQNALADPAPKKLIVLHTLGNHWNYSQRHPQNFDKWKPSLFGVVNPAYTDLKLKEPLNNSYDNSILYTDWVLAHVIDPLKSRQEITSLMYISDHGQTLYDGSCNLAFHGHNTQFEFHIPALIWYSDAYRDQFPDKVKRLLRNKKARATTENVFHTLLDMSDIRYSTEHLDYSLVSRKYKRHTRYVDSYGWTDYDNSTFKGACREVIDKGTPLKRE